MNARMSACTKNFEPFRLMTHVEVLDVDWSNGVKMSRTRRGGLAGFSSFHELGAAASNTSLKRVEVVRSTTTAESNMAAWC